MSDDVDYDIPLLADLGAGVAWQALRHRGEQMMRRRSERLARHFLEKDWRPDYEQLQYERGFFAGMKWLLDNPTMEAARLERALAEREVTRG